MYRDVFALYETTLARVIPPVGWRTSILAATLDEAGDADKALPHLQRALELKPGFPETLNSLGNVLNRLGRSAEALPCWSRPCGSSRASPPRTTPSARR